MESEKILEKARRSISKFCMEDCKAYCCRKGYLVLKLDELHAVTQGRETELEGKEILKKTVNANYSLNMGTDDMPCPSLKNHKCMIHKQIGRPMICKTFPIAIENNMIKQSPRCLAVKNGLFYPYIHRLLAMGFKESKPHPYSGMDFFEKDLNIKKIET